MHPKEIGQNCDLIAHLWREDRLQANGIPQLERAIRFARNRRFGLDVGCGCSGRFIDGLVRAGFQVEGIDVSEKNDYVGQTKPSAYIVSARGYL